MQAHCCKQQQMQSGLGKPFLIRNLRLQLMTSIQVCHLERAVSSSVNFHHTCHDERVIGGISSVVRESLLNFATMLPYDGIFCFVLAS